MVTRKIPIWLQWSGLWLILVLIPLFNRSFLQIDETRYVTVAWEMWLRGDWLVPSLNGEVYHHKPPLLFWMINLGWAIFGVNEWWPRLVPGFFSLGSLWLVAYLAQLLWPQHPDIKENVPLILLSCFLWSLFTSATMFDMVLAFFTLLGMVALVQASLHKKKHKKKHKINIKAWGLLGVAIGLGILTKGPVILLHLLPVALLAPWWQDSRSSSFLYWYLGVLSSVFLGALIALSWAIPAGLAGGEEFRQAIFWGQTANRIVNSFAHSHPLWWYLPLLPVALFPWLLWQPVWHGLFKLSQHWSNNGVRFCIIWLVSVFTGFSLISGKQLHYLLPILPAFALLVTYQLFQHSASSQQYEKWNTSFLLGFIIILIGLLLFIAPYLPGYVRVPLWVTEISRLPSIILFILGCILIVWKLQNIRQRLFLISSVAILFSLIVPLTIIRAAGSAYDLHKISQHINTLQRSGQTLAHFGDYHGQYQFLGRLQQPLPVVDEYGICPWFVKNPDGKLVVYFSSKYKTLSQYADYVQAYRSKEVGIIDAQFLLSACVKVMPF